MAYEFKNMATVDVVESVADEATVLIEEGGVIKRAPKSEVGGGVSTGLSIIREEYTLKYASEGLYEAISTMFTNFIPVNITIWNYDKEYNQMNLANLEIIYNRVDYFEITDNNAYYYYIYPDGTIEVNSYD